jgi:hypothetical protein
VLDFAEDANEEPSAQRLRRVDVETRSAELATACATRFAMTESEWLAGKNPFQMFQYTRHGADHRKLRLFACACCRLIPDHRIDERSRTAVEVTEWYADGWVTKGELSAAQSTAHEAFRDAVEMCKPFEARIYKGTKNLSDAEREAAWAQFYTASRRREAAQAAKAVSRSTDRRARLVEEMNQAVGWALSAGLIGNTLSEIRDLHSQRANLMRCVFGNPFRPPEVATMFVTLEIEHLVE